MIEINWGYEQLRFEGLVDTTENLLIYSFRVVIFRWLIQLLDRSGCRMVGGYLAKVVKLVAITYIVY